MINIIAILVVLVILGGAIAYIVKSKKKGVKCIGCPAAGSCSSKQHHQNSEPGGCSCHSEHK